MARDLENTKLVHSKMNTSCCSVRKRSLEEVTPGLYSAPSSWCFSQILGSGPIWKLKLSRMRITFWVLQWIELSETVTKTRRGNTHNIRELDPKVFPDHENPNTCPVRTLIEFSRWKNPQQSQSGKPRLWGIKQSAEQCPEKEQFWFTNTRMGTHAIAKCFGAAGVDVKLEH